MFLTILATSDVHGYIEPTNYTKRNLNLPLGLGKVATLMEEVAEKENSKGPLLKIENGDFIQGSPLSYYLAKSKKYSVTDLTKSVNALKYDAGIIGNHEFNYGLSYLQTALASYKHPMLCANILNQEGQPFFGKAYEIFEKKGVKIAVLGLTTPYIPHWEKPETIKDMTFVSIVESAKKYVPLLRQQADIVVVSYHGGFERDLVTGEPTETLTGENEGYALLKEVTGIDAFVTGHQHRQIATHLFGVPVIQPGSKGEKLGKIQLEIEKVGNRYQVLHSSAELISVTEDMPASKKVLALYEEISPTVEDWLDQKLGEVTGDMVIQDAMQARLKEHPYVEFINRVQMAASGAKISGTALFNNEGKGFNPIITLRDVITNYIYPNTLAVEKISGKDLKDALERSAQHLALDAEGKIIFNPRYAEPKPQYYNYDMYEGIDYTLDLRKPVGNQVVKLLFEGQPVKDHQSLEVVLNQYRAVGGGNYQMFTGEKIIKEIPIDMTELIADYLQQHPKIIATTNQNFTVLPQ